ncbi:hypothetical protein BCR43DRAFT_508506 [Syncephalastrum racemosum]|uniref:F-box domain-containing protein n=1 Tax=Syncephalastrum racemosum TaxID=13706 RepID=A0A1X2H0T0_SYNRA|nr:hypothetical protein BCR43DRAFT_508506 [Syncephalastrum racemosum]
MVYTWRHNLTVAWNQDPDNDLTDDFFPPMAEQLQDQLSGPIERGYRQNRQVLVVLESLGESQMKQHDYRGAIDTGRALIELVYPFEGLCMIGDAAWALGRAYEAIDYYEEAREALLEGAGARPLERVQQRIAAVQAYLAKRKDPVTTLPEEVCQRIFSHLEWQQDRTTCARVSTLWRDRVLGAPIWKTLHLSLVNGVEQRIPPDELERYLQPQLQNVHIVSHGGVEALLEKLERNGCTQLKKMSKVP